MSCEVSMNLLTLIANSPSFSISRSFLSLSLPLVFSRQFSLSLSDPFSFFPPSLHKRARTRIAVM